MKHLLLLSLVLLSPASHAATARRMGDLPSTNTVASTNIFLTTGGAFGTNSWQIEAGNLGPALAQLANAVTNGQTTDVSFSASLTLGNGLGFTSAEITGTGGANTNFTLTAKMGDRYINASTNVSLRAVMGFTPGTPFYWTLLITNGSGANRTLEFSDQTNRWRFQGVYGTNPPSVITNNTALLLSGRSEGSNTLVGYSYFAWP